MDAAKLFEIEPSDNQNIWEMNNFVILEIEWQR
jgi:hypothetical protein